MFLAERENVHEKVDVTFIELQEKIKQLSRAKQLKDDFIADLSHEIRTMLTNVIGFAELLLAGSSAGDLSPAQKEYVNFILESGRQIHSLVNDVIDLAKIEAGKLELKLDEISIEKVVDDCVGIFQERVTQKSISLHKSIRGGIRKIKADPLRLKQVINNLLANAIRFTPPGGQIGINTSLENHHLQVTIWDTGMGVPPEYQECIFIPFEQGCHSLAGNEAGCGLGLAIARRLVEQHGGKIWVESRSERGSHFCFTIPVHL